MPGRSGELVAAKMGMQVIHWEKVGVMDIFKGGVEDAVSKLSALIKKNPDLVSPNHPSRDNVGAALLHWAVIHKGVFQNPAAGAVVEYLMRSHWDQVVNTFYKEPKAIVGLFDGESALHLAVAFGDTKLIKLLLRSHADPLSRAYGSFFAPSGTNYFGEYPLSFAVACGNLEVADILVSEGRGKSLLCVRDSFGCTPLHIAAVHRRKEIFDWLLDRYCNTEGLELSADEVLGWHGGNGLTPLGLCAVMAHKDNGNMFDFILGRMSRIEWVFGRVSCTSVPLEQLDTIPLDPSQPKHVSLLTIVLCRRIYELSTHPHLVGIMEAKWKQYGAFSFFFSFLFHLFRLFLITYLAISYREYADSILEAVETHNGTSCGDYRLPTGELKSVGNDQIVRLEWVTAVDAFTSCLIVCLDCYAAYAEQRDQKEIIKNAEATALPVTMPPFLEEQPQAKRLWKEMRSSEDFIEHSSADSSGVTSWLDIHVPLSDYDLFSWIGQGLFILHMVVFMSDGKCPTPLSSAVLAISLLFVWMSTLKFTAFSRELGMLTTIVFRTIKGDVTSFLIIFSVFLVGFGTALHVLAKRNSGSYNGELDALVKIALGDTNTFEGWDAALDSDLSWLTYLLNLWFTICALVILLNLLISIFSCTFTSVRDMSEREWRLSKGRAILLLERRIKLIFPCLVHRLRVNHFHLDERDNHRYVFMTENFEAEEDPVVTAVKEAVKLGQDTAKAAAAAAGGGGGGGGGGGTDEPAETTFNHLPAHQQPEELPLGSGSAIDHDAIVCGLSEEGASSGGVPSGKQHGDTDSTNRNPLTTSLVIPSSAPKGARRKRSSTMMTHDGFAMLSEAAVDREPLHPSEEFDLVCGDGTWSKFRAKVTEEYGALSNLQGLTEDETYKLLELSLDDGTSPLHLTKCAESLYHHRFSFC